MGRMKDAKQRALTDELQLRALALTEKQIRALAREKLRALRTPRKAARELGISREALTSLASGAQTRAGTFALIREKLARDAARGAEAHQ